MEQMRETVRGRFGSPRVLHLPRRLAFLLPREERQARALYRAGKSAKRRCARETADRQALSREFGTDDSAQIESGVPAAEQAVNDAAARVRATWVTYILFWTYLVIATGSVTPLQMFLDEGVKLPVLDVDLPLTGFFAVAPVLFVVMHAYLLVQLWELRDRAHAWRRLAHRLKTSDGGYERMRRALDPYVVLQALVLPPRALMDRRYHTILTAVVWLTLVIAPAGLLIFMQIRFLPYQSEATSWLHRGVIAADLLLLSVLWGGTVEEDGAEPCARRFTGYIVCALLIGLSVFGLVFPGERMDLIVTRGAVRTALVGEWDSETYRFAATGLFDSRIVLSIDDRVVDRKALWEAEKREWERAQQGKDHSTETVGWIKSFRNRVFRGAYLERIDLRRATFDGAQLKGAILRGARLQEAHLEQAQLHGALLDEAQLQGSKLDYAQLQDASLRRSQLRGSSLKHSNLMNAKLDESNLEDASFDYAYLENASLRRAELQRSSLNEAVLERAWLEWSQLSDASLDRAKLGGASFIRAQLRGTSLKRAQLQGASFDNAHLQGAILDGAQLQGASLEWAQLQGASLEGAQLQGAWLEWAQLQGASLESSHMQGASLHKAQLQGVLLVDAQLQGVIDLYAASRCSSGIGTTAGCVAHECVSLADRSSKYNP